MSLRHLLLSTNLSTKIQSTKNTYRLFKLVKIVLIVTPHTRCRLKLLKLERIKDYLLMEEEFIRNQERLKPQEEKHEVSQSCSVFVLSTVFYHSFCQCLPLSWFKIMDWKVAGPCVCMIFYHEFVFSWYVLHLRWPFYDY